MGETGLILIDPNPGPVGCKRNRRNSGDAHTRLCDAVAAPSPEALAFCRRGTAWAIACTAFGWGRALLSQRAALDVRPRVWPAEDSEPYQLLLRRRRSL